MRKDSVDYVLHLGDYIYEYKNGEYGWGNSLGNSCSLFLFIPIEPQIAHVYFSQVAFPSQIGRFSHSTIIEGGLLNTGQIWTFC